MKRVLFVTILIVMALALVWAAEPKKACCQAAASAGTPVNANCPVTGEKADPKVTVQYEGKTVAFCCAACIAKFQAEPAKYVKNLGAEFQAREGKPYADVAKEGDKAKPGCDKAVHGKDCTCPTCKQKAAGPVNAICPVSGKPVDAKVTLKHGCCTIAFCCTDCLAKFKAEPAKYMKALCTEMKCEMGKGCCQPGHGKDGKVCDKAVHGKDCTCPKCKEKAAGTESKAEVKMDAKKDCKETCADAAACTGEAKKATEEKKDQPK
jgi:YHS domain-containing protein